MEKDVNQLWTAPVTELEQHDGQDEHLQPNVQACGAFAPATLLASMLHDLKKVPDSELHEAYRRCRPSSRDTIIKRM